MNTIPITFNEHNIPYTVLGGTGLDIENAENLFSVIILNRGGRYFNTDIFNTLKAYQFKSIFSIGNSQPSVNFDRISEQFPEIRFITPLEKITIGEMVNIGMSEANSQYVFVLWNDSTIVAQGFAGTMLEQLYRESRMCTVPALFDSIGSPILNQIIPVLQNNIFSTQRMAVLQDKTPTLYPFDFIGIYSKQKFIDVGGFDYTIKNPYWQILDFGMRSSLWGNEISIANSFKIQYIGKVPKEDASIDESYRVFFLKNLAPVISNGGAIIPKMVFFKYKKTCGQSFFNALNQFKLAQSWVAINNNKFITSAHEMIKLWEPVL